MIFLKLIYVLLAVALLMCAGASAQTKFNSSSQIDYTYGIHGLKNGTAAQDGVTYAQLSSVGTISELVFRNDGGVSRVLWKNGTVLFSNTSATRDQIVLEAARDSITSGIIYLDTSSLTLTNFTMKVNVAVRGRGINATKITHLPGAGGYTIKFNYGYQSGDNRLTDVELVRGAGLSSACGILVYEQAMHCLIENVDVNGYYKGIVGDASYGCHLNRVNIFNSGLYSIHLGINATFPCNAWNIENCWLQNQASAIVISHGSNNRITRCCIENSANRGVIIDGAITAVANVVSDSYVEGPSSPGVYGVEVKNGAIGSLLSGLHITRSNVGVALDHDINTTMIGIVYFDTPSIDCIDLYHSSGDRIIGGYFAAGGSSGVIHHDGDTNTVIV